MSTLADRRLTSSRLLAYPALAFDALSRTSVLQSPVRPCDDTFEVSEEDDDFSHAADEPTAMWDESALKELGLDSVQEQSAPATTGTGRHRAVGVDFTGANEAIAPRAASSATSPTSSGGSFRWVLLVLLALSVGAGAFFLVRALK